MAGWAYNEEDRAAQNTLADVWTDIEADQAAHELLDRMIEMIENEQLARTVEDEDEYLDLQADNLYQVE